MSTNEIIQKAGFSVATVVRDKVVKTFPANSPKQMAAALKEIAGLFESVANAETDFPIHINDMELKTESHFDTDKAERFNSITFGCVVSNVPF